MARPHDVGTAAKLAIRARGDVESLKRILDESPAPMLIVDDDRRYVEVNRPARLLFRRNLADMRRLRMDDLTTKAQLPGLKAAWKQMMAEGSVSGQTRGFPEAGRISIGYSAFANVLPGHHLIVFVPTSWSDEEQDSKQQDAADTPPGTLSRRELEILKLAAAGTSTSRIAEQLTLSPATVKTHFENIHRKLRVSTRAAAVAKAMRLGLID